MDFLLLKVLQMFFPKRQKRTLNKSLDCLMLAVVYLHLYSGSFGRSLLTDCLLCLFSIHNADNVLLRSVGN